jgi:hypothetical protein
MREFSFNNFFICSGHPDSKAVSIKKRNSLLRFFGVAKSAKAASKGEI